MNPLSALRASFARGEIDKHAFSRAMSEHHASLLAHAALLGESTLAGIELSPGRVTFVSRLFGARFPCDPSDRGLPPVVALDFGAYESKDFTMLLALMPKGGVLVDVGANIGWYTVHAALQDPTARVIAVEPIPRSFEYLTQAIARNALTNVIAINAAAAAEPGSLTLYVDGGISGAASAAPSTGEAGLDAISCEAVTLDSVVAKNGGRADVLKLDIEGAELFALRGAESVLAVQRPVVFAEMLRKLAKPFGYHPNDIITLMRGHGYGCYRAEQNRLLSFATMDDETVETNFYFLHPEAHAQQIRRWVARV